MGRKLKEKQHKLNKQKTCNRFLNISKKHLQENIKKAKNLKVTHLKGNISKLPTDEVVAGSSHWVSFHFNGTNGFNVEPLKS